MDHTAEVLENYRRMHENRLFNLMLFDDRNKKAFLRRESRSKEAILGEHWEPEEKVLSLTDFTEATRVEKGKDPVLKIAETEHSKYE